MIQLNSRKLKNFLVKEIDRNLDMLARYAVSRMQTIISNLPNSGSHDSTGASDWRLDVIQAIKFRTLKSSEFVSKKFGLVDYADDEQNLTLHRALLINYGMGSSLSRSNPYLAEYLSTPYYSTSRKGYRVYQRKGEMVYNYESGHFELSKADGWYEIPHFWQNPSYFFEQVMREVKPEFERIIDRMFNELDITQFVETKKGKR